MNPLYAREVRPLLLFAIVVAAAPAEQRTLTILHTNDLHARMVPEGNGMGGFAYLAAVMRQQRANCKDCLTLDAGDMVQGSPVSTVYRGLPIYEVTNLLGIDVSTLGNHEWDYGYQRIFDFLRLAKFPVVNANVIDGRGKGITRKAWVVRKVNGLKIALIGVLMNDLAPNYATPERLGPYKTLPVIETVSRYAKIARRRADLVVVLAHLNAGEAREIIAQVPEVNLVINGHDHNGQNALVKVSDRAVARVKAYGVELGRLELTVDKKTKAITRDSWTRIPIDSKALPPAADVAAVVKKWEDQASAKLDVEIGEAKRDLNQDQLKLLIEQAMREELGVEIAYQNLGGVRDRLKQGKILERHIWNILPFDNAAVIGKFRGADLPEVVRKAQSIDPAKEYRLATNDFVADTQFATARAGSHPALKFPEKGSVLRDLFIAWVKKKKILE
jgi:2',3'-cyclic-nucleotide 2'-phosphodiesterase (5'-nucleotidase family)